MNITTLRGHCGDGEECPGVHQLDPALGVLFVVAVRVDDPAVVAELAVDDGTLVGAVPAALFPEAREDRDPYPWLRVLPNHPDILFVTGFVVADKEAADILAPHIGGDEFAMSVPAVELARV